MNTGQMVFSQLMDFLPNHEFNQFNQCVRRYQGNYRVRKFSCLDQFLGWESNSNNSTTSPFSRS